MLPRYKTWRLHHIYRNIVRNHGAREMIKHQLTQVNQLIRVRLLEIGAVLAERGQLDDREQIFEMTLTDATMALSEPEFDARGAVAREGRAYRMLRERRCHLPLAVDSRGRILRPAQRRSGNALQGAAVAPGFARGPAKVMHDPFEKPVEPGDVLVATTTDPGWTPLFINAAAVVLEIGGELQHGALVAREYGKPCVAGIVEATSAFVDGQLLEVDGAAGTVRIV